MVFTVISILQMRKQGKTEASYFALGHVGQKQWNQDFRGHQLRLGTELEGEYLISIFWFFLHPLPTPIMLLIYLVGL